MNCLWKLFRLLKYSSFSWNLQNFIRSFLNDFANICSFEDTTLKNLDYIRKSLFANNSWCKQSYEKCSVSPNLFIELSETATSFVKIRLVFVIKNVASFMQTLFYWKRDSARMYKYLEAFHTNMAYKLALVVLLLQLLKKKIPKTPTFYIKMEHFEIVFHLMWYKRQVSRPWGPVFPTGQFLGVCFYSGPGSEPKPGF